MVDDFVQGVLCLRRGLWFFLLGLWLSRRLSLAAVFWFLLGLVFSTGYTVSRQGARFQSFLGTVSPLITRLASVDALREYVAGIYVYQKYHRAMGNRHWHVDGAPPSALGVN